MRKATPPGQHIRLERRFVRFQDVTRKARKMLKLRSIGAKAEFKAKGFKQSGVRAHLRRLKQRPDIGAAVTADRADERSSKSDSRTLSGHKAGYIVTEWPHL